MTDKTTTPEPATARDDIYARIDCARLAAGMPDTHTTNDLIANAEKILKFVRAGAA